MAGRCWRLAASAAVGRGMRSPDIRSLLVSDKPFLSDASVQTVGSASLSCFGAVVKGGRARFPDPARPIRAVLAGSWKPERASQSFRRGAVGLAPLNPDDVLVSPRRRAIALSQLAEARCWCTASIEARINGIGTLWLCVLRSQSESATQNARRGWAGRALSWRASIIRQATAGHKRACP